MSTAEHVHFIGIGGYGMSAIARVMLEMGYKVTGSDVVKQELIDRLGNLDDDAGGNSSRYTGSARF